MGLLESLGMGNFVFAPGGVASPDLSELAEAIRKLPEEERAKYYASFLEEPRNAKDGPNLGGDQSGTSIGVQRCQRGGH